MSVLQHCCELRNCSFLAHAWADHWLPYVTLGAAPRRSGSAKLHPLHLPLAGRVLVVIWLITSGL